MSRSLSPALQGHTDPEMDLLGDDVSDSDDPARNHTFKTAPVFTGDAFDAMGPERFPQKALYGRLLRQDGGDQGSGVICPKLYINTNTPFSALICGVQVCRILSSLDRTITHYVGLRQESLHVGSPRERIDQQPKDRDAARASQRDSVRTS